MKYFLLFLLTLLCLHAEETRKVLIEGKPYLFVTESYNEYGDKGITMKLYKKEQNLQGQAIFSFILENQSGSCAAKSTQDGAYDVNGTTLTLYSHWDRRGRAYDVPKGDRIQHYHIDSNGSVNFIDGMLYMETEAKNYDKQSPIQYLYHSPKSSEEEQKLQSYIQNVEHVFKGSFVRGIEATKLHRDVENAIMKKSKTRWQ